MAANETAPVVATRAVLKDRCDATGIQSLTGLGRSHSGDAMLVPYLSEFSDARTVLRGVEGVCVRLRGSALEVGLCDLSGRVVSTDRTGLLLATLQGVTDGEVDELVHFIPWRSVERVVLGFAADVLPEVAS